MINRTRTHTSTQHSTPKYLDIAQHNNTQSSIDPLAQHNPRNSSPCCETPPLTHVPNQAASSEQQGASRGLNNSEKNLPLSSRSIPQGRPARPPATLPTPFGSLYLARTASLPYPGPQPLSRSLARTHTRAVYIVPLQTTPIRAPQLRSRRERRAIPRNIVIFRHFLIYGAAR